MADEERIEPTLDPNAAAPAAGPATPANGEKPQEVEKPKSKKMLFIIIGVVVLLVAAVGGYMYMQSSAEARKIQEAEAKRPENILKKQLMEQIEVLNQRIVVMERWCQDEQHLSRDGK